jgi:hypothetical protein
MVGQSGASTKSLCTARAVSSTRSFCAASSRPTTPSSLAVPPSEATFSATLAAPPGRVSSFWMRTTGTGASGEMRPVGPCQ